MLSTRKVIVTGAASGIGKAIVKQCLHEGASIIACDLNEQALRALKESMDDSKILDTYQFIWRSISWTIKKMKSIKSLISM